ncbi:MAG: hypothetical protein J6D16_02680 [Clostridia bacterium]|nr:hypothetical protein [Clostridia bacterium]
MAGEVGEASVARARCGVASERNGGFFVNGTNNHKSQIKEKAHQNVLNSVQKKGASRLEEKIFW